MTSSLASGQQQQQQLWTDQSLMGQMNMINSLLQLPHVDLKYLCGQCLLLSKILDVLVTTSRKPLWRNELLPLVRKVCKHKDSPDVRPALLVLLLSVKDAFRADWLSSVQVSENDEIFTTLKWLFDSFTTDHDISSVNPMQSSGSAAKDVQEARVYLDLISSRFYPRLQVNTIFVAVHAEVGYEVLMCDFNVPFMHVQDRVRLYVGQKDKTETSTCVVTPPQVNILVNGHQVERRVTTGYLDAGPQMPSDVTHLVKLGSNVLQAIGEFSVSYVIAVASSRGIERSAKNAELPDYVAPAKAAYVVDPAEGDDEVVEGASRVSLRCPISHLRLCMPVKATSCRHLQCFDYETFLEINENRPAWRCPCCNSFISHLDLRIDRQMEKVLKDTDEKIHEVIFNQDGSWVPILIEESDPGSGDAMLEGCEGGSKFIDLSDVDDEPRGTWQDNDVFNQHEKKPDFQTLQALAENRGNVSHTTNPTVLPQNTAGPPVISVPEFNSNAAQSSPSSGHGWGGGGNSDGMFANVPGGGLFTTTSGIVDNQVQNQPTPSIQSMSAVNQSLHVRFPSPRGAPHVNSPAGLVNRMAPNSGPTALTQSQPPQSGVLSNIGLITENGRVRQRQFGQQPPGTPQMRPQWRSTGVPSPQLGTSSAQTPNLFSSQHNQTPASQSARQQFNSLNLQQQRPSLGTSLHHPLSSPGTSQPQRASPGINPHHHHAASSGTSHQQLSSPGASHASHGNALQQQQRQSPGITSQISPGVNPQQRGVWSGANVGQWHSTTNSTFQSQALGGAAVSEQGWRPAPRLRGGQMANSSMGQGALGTGSSRALHQQRASPVTAFPVGQGFTIAPNNPVPVPRFQVGIPVQQAANNNVSLYNGTTWVSAPEFSSSAPRPPPRFASMETSEGWLNFEDIDLPDISR